MWNMKGEFRKHHAMQLEAGHVMTLAGYNDQFQTEDGMLGGFILRNSWIDGVYALDEFGSIRSRGSHSLAYLMQTIGLADDRLLCPNSADPRNWYSCGGGGNGTDLSNAQYCMGSQVQPTAAAKYQPATLMCRPNQTECTQGMLYFLMNSTVYGDDLNLMCFLEYNPSTNSASDMCLRPRPTDAISTVFGPISTQNYQNLDDFCGYYIYPYDLARDSSAQFASFFVNGNAIRSLSRLLNFYLCVRRLSFYVR